MDTNKINILPYLKSNNFYNKYTFEEYETLFSLFDENKNFSNHGNLEQWKNILTKLPDISTNYLDFSTECIQIGNPKEINLSQLKILEKGLLTAGISNQKFVCSLLFRSSIRSFRSDFKLTA